MSLVLLLVAIISFYYNFTSIINYAANTYLVVNDQPRKSDVLVVISGGFEGERLEKAIELYKEDYAEKMIFVGGIITEDISDADLWLIRAKKLGVEPENIILDRDSTSTYENALHSAQIMEKENFQSAIVVTSPYHTVRTKMIFKKVFDKRGLSVIVVPARVKRNLADEKADRRIDIIIEEIIFEFQKLIYYKIAY